MVGAGSNANLIRRDMQSNWWIMSPAISFVACRFVQGMVCLLVGSKIRAEMCKRCDCESPRSFRSLLNVGPAAKAGTLYRIATLPLRLDYHNLLPKAATAGSITGPKLHQ